VLLTLILLRHIIEVINESTWCLGLVLTWDLRLLNLTYT